MDEAWERAREMEVSRGAVHRSPHIFSFHMNEVALETTQMRTMPLGVCFDQSYCHKLRAVSIPRHTIPSDDVKLTEDWSWR